MCGNCLRAKLYREICSIREIIINRRIGCAKVSCEKRIARKRATSGGRKFRAVCRVALFRADKRPLQHVTIREIRALNPLERSTTGRIRRERRRSSSRRGAVSLCRAKYPRERKETTRGDRFSCTSASLPSLALVSRSFRPRLRHPFAHEPGIRLVCALITLLEPSSSLATFKINGGLPIVTATWDEG